ncbi:hypothetical protein KC953_03850 [Candidatus Saccharibacteria bacterium]|nr:hypothetical protein [Candidatus Saccharibacteria bacterium]
MNPEFPAPQATPEGRPTGQDGAEYASSPESAGEGLHENEQSVHPAERQTLPPPVAVPLPPQAVPLPSTPSVAAQNDSTVGPTIANDDDLIEKEWVDKAKSIIAETQNDPFRREKEINKLQIDYLRKRYGKELGTSN